MSGPLLWASVAIAIALGLLGARLVRLASASGEHPELLLGLFFLSIGPMGFLPVFALTWAADLRPDHHLVVVGLGATGRTIAVALLTAFTWRVFRPESAWAAGLFGAILLLLSTGYAHTALVDGFGSASPGSVGWHLRIGPRVVAVSWCTIEPLRFYVMARRRVALGLMTPMIANRFLLWSIWGGACLAVLVSAIVAQFVDVGQIANGIRAGAGLVAGAAIGLTFFPPSAYARWVERRASSQAA